MIYLDNASTSWPKPDSVVEAVSSYITDIGASPARGNCTSALEALGVVLDCRESVASFFGSGNPLNVIFSHNVTWAINTVLHGMLFSGDKVVSSSMEHNAVTRPLTDLSEKGVEVVYSSCDSLGHLDLDAFRKNIAGAKLAVINHGSNVTGTVQDVSAISEICRSSGTVFLLDAAQSAGIIPVNFSQGADIIAFTGHKGLLGVPGTGGIVFADHFDPSRIKTFVQGGTGSLSEESRQPDFLPDRFEAGTMNGPGLAGLLAGIEYLNSLGLEEIYRRKMKIAGMLARGIEDIEGAVVYRPSSEKLWTAVVSFTLADSCTASITDHLTRKHNICCRHGFHCAAAAHRTIGTFPGGTVRLSPGLFTTVQEIESALKAVREYSE
ncbi:MAG: aminotransferase class V-fold PLP-dependent enzyme [Candidatus Sabulitectum sp.]|nr:aminotransferase class V-fold PLP-dependent enzyme [Candidatus Sabulitectum sp.]